MQKTRTELETPEKSSCLRSQGGLSWVLDGEDGAGAPHMPLSPAPAQGPSEVPSSAASETV